MTETDLKGDGGSDLRIGAAVQGQRQKSQEDREPCEDQT